MGCHLVVVRVTLCEGYECGRVVHFGGTARYVLIYFPHSSPKRFSKLSSAVLITHDDANPHRYEIERAPSVDGVRFV